MLNIVEKKISTLPLLSIATGLYLVK